MILPSPQKKTGFLDRLTRRITGRGEPVILASEYDYAGTVFSHAAIIPHLANLMNAQPRSFSFVSSHRSPLTKVYKSIGIPRALGQNHAAKHLARAEKWARQALPRLRSRQELLDLELEDFPLGMVIYDTYMRAHCLPTVDLTDERLMKAAVEAAAILYATIDYFDTHTVSAVFPDHFVYNYAGILAQYAWRRDIPVFIYSFAKQFYLYRIPARRKAQPRLEVPYQHTFDQYPEDFALLDNQEQRLEKARLAIDEHLNGRKTDLIFGGHSAYGAPGTARRLGPAKRPRIVIMLHDFCDAPHVYGKFLFPDFVEWMDYLLDRAAHTDFEWIIKPHPNLQDQSRAQLVKTNNSVVEDLKRRYPHVTFIDPQYSNHHLIEDGVKALFTVRGSAGHELAYLGIPVVNAGPNPHMRYGFNFHAQNLAEYDEYIANADRLKVGGSKGEIEEFYYMRYFSMQDRFAADFTPVPADKKTERPTIDLMRQWEAEYGRAIREPARRYVEEAYKTQVCASP